MINTRDFLNDLVCDHIWSYQIMDPIQPGEGYIPVVCKKCKRKQNKLVKYSYTPAGMVVILHGQEWKFAEPFATSIKWTMEWPNNALRELQ
ncbi:MAG: hypothetical protein KCHDKBKB_00715 [Elusimicrobia bacterium]|nr:hypothetical protein [Elusimicrobiota bacterium]